MNRIVVVSFNPVPDPSLIEWADDVRVSPAVPRSVSLPSKSEAIKAAMIDAVLTAEPGDVVMQDDVEFHRSPFETNLRAGAVTILTKRISPQHVCPRAFRFATVEDQLRIVDLWSGSPMRTCLAWDPMPKIMAVRGVHDGGH